MAIDGAKAGDEVIVNPGDYPLATTLFVPTQVTMHGVAGRPRPRLVLTGAKAVLYQGSLLRYVEIAQTQASDETLFSFSATVDQVVVKAAEGTFCAERTLNSTIRNSIVVTPEPDSSAICKHTGADTNSALASRVAALWSAIPALLTSTSTRPKRSTADSTIRWQSSSRATSAATARP
jgi:hypothetical protein